MKRLAVVVLVLLVCGCSRGPSPAEKREAALKTYDLETRVLDRAVAKRESTQQGLKQLLSVMATNLDKTAEDKRLQAESKELYTQLSERLKELDATIAKQNAKVVEAKKALDALE